MDNGFGSSIIDNRGNEEATWQEIVRGDVKRFSIEESDVKRLSRTIIIDLYDSHPRCEKRSRSKNVQAGPF